MSFNDFVHKYKLKNKATSNKIQQVISSLYLDNVGIYLRDGTFESDIGIVNLPFEGTHWVLYIHECYFYSYGCPPPNKLSKLIIKRNGHCLYSEYKTQGLPSKKDSYCDSYFLYIIYLTINIGTDFKSAVVN